MRTSAVFVILSLIGIMISGCSYAVISTPGHLAKAASIAANPNGDVLWLHDWQFNRMISLVGAGTSLAVFVWSYIVLWKAQRDELKAPRSWSRTIIARPDGC